MRSFCHCLAIIAIFAAPALLLAAPAMAEAPAQPALSAGLLQAAQLSNALRPSESQILQTPPGRPAFSVASNLYDGTDFLTTGFGNMADDARSMALLVDGIYNFERAQSLRPYVSGGMGFALHRDGGLHYIQRQGTEADTQWLPMFRLGAGLNYQLGEAWDLSLNYQAGFTGRSSDALNDTNAQNSGGAASLQQINTRMQYRF